MPGPKPIGAVLVGPPGVGKSTVAKILLEILSERSGKKLVHVLCTDKLRFVLYAEPHWSAEEARVVYQRLFLHTFNNEAHGENIFLWRVRIHWSGRRDLNPESHEPESCMLPLHHGPL